MSTISRQVSPPQDPHAGDELLTIAEVADVVRVPVATLRYWRHLGTGPHSFRIGRTVRYRAPQRHHLAATADLRQ